MIEVAIDSSSLNIKDSRLILKNWYFQFRPTRNVAKKHKTLKRLDGIDVGLFCNGTYGLNMVKMSEKHNVDVLGLYLSKKFVLNLLFSEINEILDILVKEVKFVDSTKGAIEKTVGKIKNKFVAVLSKSKIKKTLSNIRDKKVISKLMRTRDFVRGHIDNSKQMKKWYDDMLRGNVFDLLIENRVRKLLKNNNKILGYSKKVLRLDVPWMYFSIYDMLKDSFDISIDCSPDKYICICEYFRRMKNLKRTCCDLCASLDITALRNEELLLYTQCFFAKMKEVDSSLKCNVLVINYLTGLDQNTRKGVLHLFAEHVKDKKIKKPMIVVKFSKNQYYAAEGMFDVFLSEIKEIFEIKTN